MRALALDTALNHVSAAVLEVADTGRTHVLGSSCAPAAGNAEALPGHVDAALAAAGTLPAAIDRLIVTVGPGSFTGVRVALSYAKGWGVALGCPVLGITSLETLARTHGSACVAVVDARHGAVYGAVFDENLSAGEIVRMDGAQAGRLAQTRDVPVVGLASGVAATGGGIVIEQIDPAALGPAALGDPALRPPRAAYVAPVDAAPQSHKALARA